MILEVIRSKPVLKFLILLLIQIFHSCLYFLKNTFDLLLEPQLTQLQPLSAEEQTKVPPQPVQHNDRVVDEEADEEAYQDIAEEHSGNSVDKVSEHEEMDAEEVHSELVKDVLDAYLSPVPLHFHQDVHQH